MGTNGKLFSLFTKVRKDERIETAFPSFEGNPPVQ